MKQTQNAIKFLMAQYRAIFKHAYLKGLVSAVALTTAVSISSNANAYGTVEGINVAESDLIIGSSDTFQISGAGSNFGAGTSADPATINRNITIDSDKGSGETDHQLTLPNSDTDFYVTSDKTFTVTSKGVMNFGVLNEANKGTLQVHFGTFDFKSGSTVNIYANAHTGSDGSSGSKPTIVDGDTINVSGTLTLKSTDGSNAVLQGDNINITSGATVKLDASASADNTDVIGKAVLGFTPSSTSSGSIIDVNGAKLILLNNTPTENDSGSQRSSSQIWGSKLTLTDSSLTVSGAGAGNEDFTLKGSSHLQTHTNEFNNSTIYLEAGANLNINPQEVYSKEDGTYAHINGTVDINGGIVALGGDLVLNRGGTLRISEDTKLFATQADSNKASNPFINPKGSISIGIEHSIANKTGNSAKNFIDSTNPTLEISSKTLDSFFSGDGTEKHEVINAEGTKIQAQDYAGKVILTDGARVKFTDTNTVTISDYSFGVYSTSDDPAPKENTSANFYAYQASTTGKIGSQTEKMDASIRMYAYNMAIEKSLIPTTAATDGEENSSQNIIFEADNLTLGSKGYNETTSLGIKEAQARNVTFLASGSLDFTLADKLTLRSITGSAIDSVEVADNGTITGDVIIGEEGSLNVDGGLYSTSNDVTLASGSLSILNTDANNSSLTISGGKFVLDNTSGANIITISGSEDNLAVLDISKADVKVSGDATIATFAVVDLGASLILTGDDVTNILHQEEDSISGSIIYLNKGNLKVVDSLTINADQVTHTKDSSYDTASGNIVFNTDHGGNLNVAKTLTINGTTGTIDIGASGSITADKLVLNNASSNTVTLSNGTYNVLTGLATKSSTDTVKLANYTELNLGNSTTSVGGGSLANLDLADTSNVNVNYGTWNGGKLSTVDGSKLTVNTGATLTLAGISGSGSGLSLSGSTVDLYGNLTFGSGVAEDISVSDAATPIVTAEGISGGAINLQGGTLRIEFTSNDKFSSDQLIALKNYLFSGSTDGSINGILNIGAGQIAGVDLSKEETVDNRYNYDAIAGVAGVSGTNVTNDDLVNNAFYTDDPSKVSGIIGGLHVTNANGTAADLNNTSGFVNTDKNNGYFVSYTNSNGEVVAADINFNGKYLYLENGGSGGDVSFGADSEVIIKSADKETVLGDVTGSGTFTVNGNTKTQDVDVEKLSVTEGNTLESTSLAVGNTSETTTIDGDIVVTDSGDATFAGDYVLNGTNQIGGDLTSNGEATVNGDTVVGGTATFADNATVAQGATLTADTVGMTGSGNLFVGNDSGSGFVQGNTLSMGGSGFLIADPAYDQAATMAIFDKVKSTRAVEVEGGSIGAGGIAATQNSIIALGVDNATDADAKARVKAMFADLLDSNGSLDKNNVGAIVYVGKAVEVDVGSKVIVDSTVNSTGFNNALNAGKYTSGDAYISANSAIAIDFNALNNTQGAIHFDTDSATIYNEKGGKVLLVGDGFNTRDEIILFTDTDAETDTVNGGKGVFISGSTLRVETLNGLFFIEYAANDFTSAQKLTLDTDRVEYVFNDASAPVKHSLIAYASDDNNWDNVGTEGYKLDELHGAVANGVQYKDGKLIKGTTDITDKINEYVITGDATNGYTVYHAAFNSFLDYVTTHEMSGRSAEQVARLGVYGGAAQATLSAGATTYDAISGRMGVGAQTGSITFADNGQGAGLWVSPIYKNHDSDGFASQGPSYGVDMDMFGLALGGDFTMANGLRVGAAFNVGSGDADGQGMASGVSNDFDYYGFSVYGGFSMDKFSVVADVSYSVIDNDVQVNTANDKISSSFDSSNLSVGVTGQYALDYNGMSIVPHAGLRYTNIDMDDYTVSGAEYGEIAKYGADSFNVFSIPVGVTFSKDITAGSWIVKPALDLTLTANMGDDSVDGSVAWTGIDNLTTKVSTEVVDSFTYGVTAGVGAKSGNFSMGFGVNYTGASSADEYGVNANVRYTF